MRLPSTYRRVLGLLVDVRGVDHVRVQHQVVAHRGEQPGSRRGVAGVTADGAVDARRDQHHGVERVGARQPPVPEVEHARLGVVRTVNLRLDGFDFAEVAGAALARNRHAQRRRILAEGQVRGVAQVLQRRAALKQLTNCDLLR